MELSAARTVCSRGQLGRPRRAPGELGTRRVRGRRSGSAERGPGSLTPAAHPDLKCLLNPDLGEALFAACWGHTRPRPGLSSQGAKNSPGGTGQSGRGDGADAEGPGRAEQEHPHPRSPLSAPCRALRRRPAPMWASPNRRSAGARVMGALLLCKYKGSKRLPGAVAGQAKAVGRGSRVGPPLNRPGPGARSAAAPASVASAPVARLPGRGWMWRGPLGGGGLRPPAPGAPRAGVRGPGAPRPPCARARPETAGGPRRSRRCRRGGSR